MKANKSTKAIRYNLDSVASFLEFRLECVKSIKGVEELGIAVESIEEALKIIRLEASRYEN